MDAFFIFCAKYLYLAAVLIILWVFVAQSRDHKKRMIAIGLATLVIAFILDVIAGHLYFDARPFVVGAFTPLISHAADNGFPSDHTILVSALAMVAWYFNKKASWLIWAVAFIVGAARVYVGVHHPIDILGSAVLAIIAGVSAHYAVRKLV
jgi:undecaprenyl-diphosphatase